VDQIHVNGIQNKFWESDDSVERSIKACLTPMPGGNTILRWFRRAMGRTGAGKPIVGPKQFDLLYLAAAESWRIRMDRRAGVKALRQAWEAAVAGLSVEELREIPEFQNR